MSDHLAIALSLLAILLASSLVLSQLLRRHTVNRDRFVKWEWSVNHRFRRGEPGLTLISGLDEIQNQTLHAVEHYRSKEIGTSIYRLRGIDQNEVVRTWHLLVRTLAHYSTPIALRPVSAETSLVDLTNLQFFPRLSGRVRFAVYGQRALDARRLAIGHVIALIPPDIGLIRNEDELILDFTNRPFDTVEFTRMLAVADQLATVLQREEAAAGTTPAASV